jgi:hypothetical protein
MHIAEIARAMLNEKNLPNYFWAEAVATVVTQSVWLHCIRACS